MLQQVHLLVLHLPQQKAKYETSCHDHVKCYTRPQ